MLHAEEPVVEKRRSPRSACGSTRRPPPTSRGLRGGPQGAHRDRGRRARRLRPARRAAACTPATGRRRASTRRALAGGRAASPAGSRGLSAPRRARSSAGVDRRRLGRLAAAGSCASAGLGGGRLGGLSRQRALVSAVHRSDGPRLGFVRRPAGAARPRARSAAAAAVGSAAASLSVAAFSPRRARPWTGRASSSCCARPGAGAARRPRARRVFGEFEQHRAALGMGHLATAEHDRHLDLVLVLEEALDMALLGVVVVRAIFGRSLISRIVICCWCFARPSASGPARTCTSSSRAHGRRAGARRRRPRRGRARAPARSAGRRRS